MRRFAPVPVCRRREYCAQAVVPGAMRHLRSNQHRQHFSRRRGSTPRYVKPPGKITRFKLKQHVFVKLGRQELVACRFV
jgi:hypothetical protein